MLQMRIYSTAYCRSQNCFSQNEHTYQASACLNVEVATVHSQAFCVMSDVNWCFVQFNGTAVIVCLSAVHMLYELYRVK
jgi:hypothetical protein